MKIILASKSPARKKVLTSLLPGLALSGVEGFEVMPAEIDEEKIREKSPSATVKKIALLKAKEISHKLKIVFNDHAIACHLKTNNRQLEETVIISADTMVYRRGLYIGKPKDKNDAKRILTTLSGTTHWLYSGICVLYVCHCEESKTTKQSSSKIEIATDSSRLSLASLWDTRNDVRIFTDFDRSKVTFRKLSAQEIGDYVASNNVHLWAGAYTIEKGTAGASFIKEIKGSSSNVLGLPVKKLKKILRKINLISN